MKDAGLKQFVLFIFKMMKKWSPTTYTRILCNMKQDESCEKQIMLMKIYDFLVKGEILLFHQYLYNKCHYFLHKPIERYH